MRKLCLGLSFAAMALFVSCSDSGTDSESAEGEVAEVKTVYGLGECEELNEGVVKLVTSENQYYKCMDGDWKETEAPVQSSSTDKSPFAGSSSSNTAFPDVDTKSSASSEIFSTDSKSGYDPVKQTLTDSRDEQVYRTVKIGNQVWMAENLNYRYLGPTADLDSSSFCFDDDPTYCTRYGRLYLWSAATDSAGIIMGNTANGCGYKSVECALIGAMRGVCPQGWHLPSKEEFNALFESVDGRYGAGRKLKATSGWKENSNGDDTFGFSVLPTGNRDNVGNFYGEGDIAFFWSFPDVDNEKAYYVSLSYENDNAYLGDRIKYYGLSVRCLKD